MAIIKAREGTIILNIDYRREETMSFRVNDCSSCCYEEFTKTIFYIRYVNSLKGSCFGCVLSLFRFTVLHMLARREKEE